jgi:hypothetical protein
MLEVYNKKQRITILYYEINLLLLYEMMLFYYLGGVSELTFDETYVTGRAREISEEAASVWLLIQEAAQEAASQA